MARKRSKTARLLNRFAEDLANLYLTFVTPDVVSTFPSDNARHLARWWTLQIAKLRNPDRDHWCALKDVATGLPIKRLSCCYIRRNTIEPLSADETRYAFSIDPDAGKWLPPMSDVVFVDFA